MKKYVFLLFFSANIVMGQSSINHYKYVIVPAKFSFLKDIDGYKLNTLTKLVLEKYGFKPYFDTEELPTEISDSNCDKLYADVVSSGNFIRTKLQLILRDCQKNIVYQTAIGTSKEKEYRVAYTQALRAAFQSFDTLHYQFSPTEKIESTSKSAVVLTELINQPAEILQAQPITNGFQVVDGKSAVVMKIFKTSNPSTYSAVRGDTQGVLISKEGQWFFEYYQDEKLISEKINVKF